MANRRYFVISDTHFGHANTINKFKLSDGVTPLRSFKDVEEMDQHIIDQWNKTVGDNDVVYHLGDVVINNKFLHRIRALRGVKRLILGNHDVVNLDAQDYLDVGFENVFGVTKPAKYPFYLSHIPLHAGSIPRWCRANVHGHLHGRRVMMDNGYGKQVFDPRYICVAVENVCYTPVDLDQIVEYANTSKNIWGQTYCWDEGEIQDDQPV